MRRYFIRLFGGFRCYRLTKNIYFYGQYIIDACRIKMTMTPFPFSQYLFWDAQVEDIDLQKNKRYVIERVMTRGKMEDLETLLILYSKGEIRAALKESKELDPKTRHFCSWYFEIPENELHASSFYR